MLAVDLRRQSLAFLWIRARWGGQSTVQVIHGRVDDPRLPPGPVDAVLIANTYHELSHPRPVLNALFAVMRPGARLVVVDRSPRRESETAAASGHHEITRVAAEQALNALGFHTVTFDDRFIDRAVDDDVWWLLVLRKP